MSQTIPRVIRIQHLRLDTRSLGVLQIGQTVGARPLIGRRQIRLRSSRSLAWRRRTPLRSRRTSAEGARLICLRRDVLRQWCALGGQTVGRLSLEQSETSLDVDVGGIKLGCSRVGVKGIVGLVVATLVLHTVSKLYWRA